MEQKITIEVPEGKKAIYNEKTQTIEFVDIEPSKSKSWEEFCKNHPISRKEYYLLPYGIAKTDSVGYVRNRHDCYLGSKEDAEGIIALIQLIRLHDEWVGDWVPDYTNDEPKWHIYFYFYDIHIAWSSAQKRFLAFPTKKMAKEFVKCFRDLIEKAKKFI